MNLNDTPKAVRIHIALLGKRNSGKSSIINAITNQEASIVSDIKGTTTDPVYKAIEILPLGPCVLIDTAGIDDDSTLGKERIKKTREVLNKTDIVLYVVDSNIGLTDIDKKTISEIKEKSIPLVLIFNKIDILK